MAQRMLARRGAGERDGKQVAAETCHLEPFKDQPASQGCRQRDERGSLFAVAASVFVSNFRRIDVAAAVPARLSVG
jgi:hypothetical protein